MGAQSRRTSWRWHLKWSLDGCKGGEAKGMSGTRLPGAVCLLGMNHFIVVTGGVAGRERKQLQAK